MASCGTCLLFSALICITIAGCDFNFVNLKCNSDNHGRFGHQSLLECIVNLSQEAQDAQITRVIWIKEGAETALIEYSRGGLKFTPHFTFAEPEWNGRNMNVSMLVNNTRIADIGIYKCAVVTDRGGCRTSTSLSVSGSNPIQEEEKPNLASKVVLHVVTVSVIIGLLVFLIKFKGYMYSPWPFPEVPIRIGRRTHEPIATDNQDQFNGEHQPTEPCPWDAHV